MKLTWFGHSAFRIEIGAARILIDPFLTGNPSFTGDPKHAAEGCTHVLLTHGHGDHLGDALDICKRQGAQLVGSAEVCGWLSSQGVKNANPGNHGGTVDCGGFTVSFVNALHSSSFESGGSIVYMGNPLGLIVKASGEPTLYHMGDTDIFGDMRLIAEIHEPEIGIVPIGDRFTMGPRVAAIVCERFFRFRTIIPCHYGTFPLLTGTPEAFRAALSTEADKLVIPERGVVLDV
jgi:L-ascorbate metabolism protein UlaG (beta-lactamase superfamily)